MPLALNLYFCGFGGRGFRSLKCIASVAAQWRKAIRGFDLGNKSAQKNIRNDIACVERLFLKVHESRKRSHRCMPDKPASSTAWHACMHDHNSAWAGPSLLSRFSFLYGLGAQNKMGGTKTTSRTYKSTVKMDDFNVDRGM